MGGHGKGEGGYTGAEMRAPGEGGVPQVKSASGKGGRLIERERMRAWGYQA